MEQNIIIQLLANIATILGFSMNAYEHLNDNTEAADRAMLYFLKHLSIKSKSIKEIHMKYHALQYQMQSISVVLRDHSFYNRNVDEKLKKELLLAFKSDVMLAAQCNLETELAPVFKNLKITLKKIDTQSIADEEIRDYIERIIDSQKKLTKLHKDYTRTLKKISSFPMGEWTESEYDYIRQEHRIFIVVYFQIIEVADLLIMRYLDVFNSVINKYVE